jgi:hypothetical protein
MPEGKGKRVVLFSDGNETAGDTLAAADAAGMDGVEIDVYPLGIAQGPVEAAVLEMQSPTERRVDEPFELRIILESSVDQSGVIVIDRDGVVMERIPVQIPKGRSSVVTTQQLDDPGFYRYRATLEPSRDTDVRNNIGASFVSVKGRPKVLILQTDPSESALARALGEQGLLAEVFGPGGAPVQPQDLQPYDAIILNDFNAALISEYQMELIRTAVRDTGIGLMMVGGENSYLPGGWYGTPVAEALPVDLNIRQRRNFPSTSVLIVVDASGSMGAMEGGMQKIQLAAKAANETVKLLSPFDRIGVAGSTDGIEFVAPMQKLSNKEAVSAQVRKLRTGGGGIYAEMSVNFADKTLRAEDSKVRHFILVADGADTDTYGTSLGIIGRMRADKITTSVVAIGDGKDIPFLKAAAAAGGGRFYMVQSASRLPAIFTQDVASIGRSAIEEFVFIPTLTAGEEMTPRGSTASAGLSRS